MKHEYVAMAAGAEVVLAGNGRDRGGRGVGRERGREGDEKE